MNPFILAGVIFGGLVVAFVLVAVFCSLALAQEADDNAGLK